MAPPDLRFARATVAGLLPGRCTVTRNPGGVADDQLDPDTMQLVPQDAPPWYDGPCAIRLGDAQQDGLEGVGTVTLPFDPAADPTDGQLLRGDVVRCVADPNPALVGRSWEVGEPLAGSFSVSRRARLLEARR